MASLPNARDTTSQDPPSRHWATWTKFGKALTPCNHELQPTPPFPRRHYLTCPTYTSTITGSTPPKNHITRASTSFSCTHMPSTAHLQQSNGWFPITSNWGNAYVVVFYVFDANYTCSVPIKNRSKEELLSAYRKTYEWMTLRGFKPPSFTQWTTRHRTR